jgi:hypothetical protein
MHLGLSALAFRSNITPGSSGLISDRLLLAAMLTTKLHGVTNQNIVLYTVTVLRAK